MAGSRPFLSMLLRAYEPGDERVRGLVVTSPSDEDEPIWRDLGMTLPTLPRLASFDDDPTEPTRARHPLSSSDESVRRIEVGVGRRARRVARPVDERRLGIPVVVGARTSTDPEFVVHDTDEDARDQAAADASRADDRVSPAPVEWSTARGGSDVDLPTWRLPKDTVVLDGALLAALLRDVSGEGAARARADAHEEATDPLLVLTFSSLDDEGADEAGAVAATRSMSASLLLSDDEREQGEARALFVSAIEALSSGDRARARALLERACACAPHDALLGYALAALDDAAGDAHRPG